MDVYLFPSCLSDMLNRKIQKSVTRLLEAAGVRVHISKKASCCAQPAYNSGYVKSARLVARQQLVAFPQDWPIILPSASCTSMIKHHYTKLFTDKKEKPLNTFAEINHLSERTHEFSSFYRELSPHLQDYGDEIAVLCPPSCHALRELKMADKARQILSDLKNVKLLHILHERECCGFGGTFSVKHAKISTARADKKIDEIMEAVQRHQVKKLLGVDYSCLLHLQGRIQKRGLSLEVQHLACFLEERLFGLHG